MCVVCDDPPPVSYRDIPVKYVMALDEMIKFGLAPTDQEISRTWYETQDGYQVSVEFRYFDGYGYPTDVINFKVDK